MKRVLYGYVVLALIFFFFSFGFVDPNLHLSTHPAFTMLEKPLINLVYSRTLVAACVYAGILIALFVLYGKALSLAAKKTHVRIGSMAIITALLFFFAYPALSYDIFNYILTAKVTFYYHENPYLVMPIELLGEPMLAFTRAANKFALYGPVWIAATYVPHMLSQNNIVFSIYFFKLLSVSGYIGLIWLLYRHTKSVYQTVFFALNPLIILETFVSGHNDAFMMMLAIGGLLLVQEKAIIKYLSGWLLLVASVFVKGATIVAIPIALLLRTQSYEKQIKWMGLAIFGVFLLSPLREEMYPWYATWWIACVAFIPIKPRSYVHAATYWLSLGLMMRYIPWIATREYGGITPMVREAVTWIPIGIYTIWYKVVSFMKKS